jgi:hypothetical protein
LGEEDELESRMTQMQEGEDDEDINTNDISTPIQVPIAGPISRARAHPLNHQVSSLLSSCLSCLDHGDMCTIFCLGTKETTERETDSRWLDSDYRTAQTCSSTSWKACEVFFQTDPSSYPYLFGVGRHRRITIEFFSAHGGASLYFSPMGRISS